MWRENKPIYEKPWFIIVVCFLVIVFLNTAIQYVRNNPNNSSRYSNLIKQTNSQQPSLINSPSTIEQKDTITYQRTVGINELLTVGDFSYVVHDVEVVDTISESYYEHRATGTYMVVYMFVINNSNGGTTIQGSYFKIKYGEKTYEFDLNATLGVVRNKNLNSLAYEGLNPDMTLTGYIVFDVTEEVATSDETMLQVQTDYSGKQTGLISLTR